MPRKKKEETSAAPKEPTPEVSSTESQDQAIPESTLIENPVEAKVRKPEGGKPKSRPKHNSEPGTSDSSQSDKDASQEKEDPIERSEESVQSAEGVQNETQFGETPSIEEAGEHSLGGVENQVTASPKKIGFWKRLFGIFKTRNSKVESNEVVPKNDAAQYDGILTAEELALESDSLRKLLLEEKKELEKIENSIRDLKAVSYENELKQQALGEASEKLANWKAELASSFIGKVQQKMDNNLETATADLSNYEFAVNNVKEFEPGTLLKLRKAFHKSFTRNLLFTGGLISLVTLIKFRDNLPQLDWLRVLYDSNTSGPVLIFAAISLIGCAALFMRFAGKKILKASKLLKFILWVSLFSYLIWISGQAAGWAQRYVYPFIDRHYFEIVSAILGWSLIWLLGALIHYYSEWSVFERRVRQQILELRGVIDGYVKTQQEVERLSSLYKQAAEWLQILAMAVYRPWKTNPDWGQSKEYRNHYDTFPMALRVAQAQEGNEVNTAVLDRLISAKLYRQGWRNDAFEKLVDQVGLEIGLPSGKFTVEILDRDLPHQTNNTRKVLRKFLDHAAKTEQAGLLDLESKPIVSGQTPSPTDKYLVEVAKSHLLFLIQETQSEALSTAKPNVQQIVEDPLIDIRSDEGGIEQYNPAQPWDEFMTETTGIDVIEQAVLGVLSFTESGRLGNLPKESMSYIITPVRLESSLPKSNSEKVVIKSVGDAKSRPVEIIARVDVVGPIEFEKTTLFRDSAVPQTKNTDRSMSSKDEEL